MQGNTLFRFAVVDLGALPTAPRAALEATYNHISQDPPFVACATNLSFQIDDEALRRIFADLNVRESIDYIKILDLNECHLIT